MADEDDLYSRVVAFVAQTTGIRTERIHATTRLGRDCGVDGDDAAELMIKFSERFSVDLSEFHFDRHFGPEGGGNPFVLLRNILSGESKLAEIRIQDLVAAARVGRWTYDLPDDGVNAMTSR